MKSDRPDRSFGKAHMYERSRGTDRRSPGRGTLTGRLIGYFKLLKLDVKEDTIAGQLVAHARELEDERHRAFERIHGLERQIEELRAARR